MVTRIHVNQHVIKANKKDGKSDPVLTAKTSKGNTYAKHLRILGSRGEIVAEVIYSPDKPLDCGAHVWIETFFPVEVVA